MSERATPETDELLNTIRELECELAATTKARDHNRTCVKRLTQERDEVMELARKLRDALEKCRHIIGSPDSPIEELWRTDDEIAEAWNASTVAINKAKEVLP